MVEGVNHTARYTSFNQSNSRHVEMSFDSPHTVLYDPNGKPLTWKPKRRPLGFQPPNERVYK